MSTQIFVVPAGQTLPIPAPALASILVQPGSNASMTYGPDGIGSPQFPVPQSPASGAFSFCPQSYAGGSAYSPNPMGLMGKAFVSANVLPAIVTVADLTQFPGSFPERQTVFQSGVAFSVLNSTAEQTLASVRFPAGFLKPNFRLEFAAQLSCNNSAAVKTLKTYFGASSNGTPETAAAFAASAALTSLAGAYVTGSFFGRNDGQNVIASNVGLASAGGMGSSVTANVNTAVNYSGPNAVETVFTITATKATGTDVFTLDGLIVKVYQ
jgi:hypothetical protein